MRKRLRKAVVAHERKHVVKAVEVAVKGRAAHGRGPLNVAYADLVIGLFPEALRKPHTDKLDRGFGSLVLLDVVHIYHLCFIFCGTIVS